MSRIRFLPLFGDTTHLYTVSGLALIDDFTSGPPQGRISARLDIKENNDWRPTQLPATITPGGVITYPGLGHHISPADQPVRRYRIVVQTEFYRPLYPPGQHGFEFDVFPWNDSNPPQQILKLPSLGFLCPSAAYPFPAHVPVIRGRVVDPADVPVPDAQVSDDNRQTVLSDSRGEFALPLRWAKPNADIIIDARDNLNRSGQVIVQIPRDLGRGQIISIS